MSHRKSISNCQKIRRSPLLLLGFVFWALVTVLCPRGAISQESSQENNEAIFSTYGGKYADQPEFELLMEDSQFLYRSALEKIRVHLGLSPGKPSRIQLILRDAQPEKALKVVRFRDSAFKTSTRFHASGKRVQVLFHTEFLMNHSYSLQEEFEHELTHAVMRERMEVEHYAALPKWLREGLALWVAGQIPRRVVVVLSGPNINWNLESAFPGLEIGKHTLDRYPESGLAVEYLVATCGEDGLRKFIGRLVCGVPYREALQAETGLHWDAFSEQAKNYARKRAVALRPVGLELFCVLQELRKRQPRNFVAEAEACQALLARKEIDPWFRMLTFYYYGYALHLSGRHQEAVEVLTQKAALGQPAGAHPFTDNGLFCLGRSLVLLRRWSEAADVYRRLLRDHPYSPHLERALFYLATCLDRKGERAAAVERYHSFARSFPDSDRLPRVLDRLKQLDSDWEAAPTTSFFKALRATRIPGGRIRCEVELDGRFLNFWIYAGPTTGGATSRIEVNLSEGRYEHRQASRPGRHTLYVGGGPLEIGKSGKLILHLPQSSFKTPLNELHLWAYCEKSKARFPQKGRQQLMDGR